jgi:hypothetical protein
MRGRGYLPRLPPPRLPGFEGVRARRWRALVCSSSTDSMTWREHSFPAHEPSPTEVSIPGRMSHSLSMLLLSPV